ncbi:LysM peptidoglycan-binding domain-containing protein [Rhizobium sp. C4]|uniref:LysM peptidoglycan-binding domain-containing protein n=1 Tax=Rhizobium sp. C4 TaxID=1349800 RepID=UPI001E6139C6|nr:LysM peptidoglycan-binding domain-containing protein [Rhizobium sp. C4]MCD2171906.1 LysM peptidoglycan-binding domain-containing protein [Rhizobium sp. C4]
MQNNRAVWLAILVLVIASAVMIFFVLPQINGGKDVAGDAAKTVPETTQPAANTPAGSPVDTASKATGAASGAELLQKMNRLKADASAASESLRALYANGKVPTDAELADAKTKLQAALKAIADFKAPEGADATVGGLVTGLSASATKALSALKSMPEDAGKAADAAAQIAALFSDKTARNGTTPAATAPSKPAAPDAIEATLPNFDVLRVEKDGSTVIAGGASPKAKVEVLDGDKVIGSAVAGPSGDFAIALDKPLEPGDHSLVLRATGADGKTSASAEVATVSVPNGKDGKLLAMVTKPGEASRILTKPDADNKVAQATDAQPAAAGASATTLPPLPDASKTLASSAPAVPAAQQAQTASADAMQKPAEAAAIRIDAVEIEGDKIFVAGSTRPQATVQVFADDKLIETTKSADSGHFEAENTMPLSTGNHIIRADLMDQSGSKVVVRASVPFNRPAGDQVSVVADTAKPAGNNGASAASQPAMGQLEQLREEAAKALVLLKGLFADGKTPAKDQLAAARSATQFALKALADFKPAAEAGPDVAALAAKVGKSAADALKLLQAAGDDPKGVGAAIASIEAAAREAMPDVAKPAAPAAPAAAETSSAAASATTTQQAANAPATAAPAADQPKSIEQAPLKESKDSVIIRKGDTLWQISRRVYGRGVRYTTIYLANQDLINNPNRIAPGQVFGVPGKISQSDEDAEKANRELRKKH